MTDEEFEPGVGCRVVLSVFLILLGLFAVGATLLFLGDPEAVEYWRLWIFSSFAPVSGIAMSFGGRGVWWTLDAMLWLGVAFWIARPDDVAAVRRRLALVLTLTIALGALTAAA